MTQAVTADEEAPVFQQGDIVTFKFHPLYQRPLPTGFSYGVVVSGNHRLKNPGGGITIFPILDRAANLRAVPAFQQLEDIDLVALNCALPAWTMPVLPAGRFIRPDLAMVIGFKISGVEPTGDTLPKDILRYSLDQFSRLITPGDQPVELRLADHARYHESVNDRAAVVSLVPPGLSRRNGAHLFVRLYTNPLKERENYVSMTGFEGRACYARNDIYLAPYGSFKSWGNTKTFVAPEKMWEIRSSVLFGLGMRGYTKGADMRPIIAVEKELLSRRPAPLRQLAQAAPAPG